MNFRCRSSVVNVDFKPKDVKGFFVCVISLLVVFANCHNHMNSYSLIIDFKSFGGIGLPVTRLHHRHSGEMMQCFDLSPNGF